MRILITGGAGFLGHHLCEHFLRTTHAEIVVLDKLTYASSGFDRLRDIQAYDDERVRVLGCDLSYPIPDGIRQEIGLVDYVIHAAAESHVDNSIIDPVPFIQSNVMGTHHLLWFARTLPDLRRVFCISTDEAYGPAGWDSPGNTEEDPFRPANPYAAAKAGGECIAMAYANTYNIPTTIVSTMNLLGERQHFQKMVPHCIRSVLRDEEVTIHADPTCTRAGTRFYIHCRNFASALSYLMSVDERGVPSTQFTCEPDGTRLRWDSNTPERGWYGVDSPPESLSIGADAMTQALAYSPFKMPLKIHVAGEREISNLDLAQMIAGFIGKPLRYRLTNFHESRPGHDLRYALSARKIGAIGWRQPIDIERSLEKTVRWSLDNRRWLGL